MLWVLLALVVLVSINVLLIHRDVRALLKAQGLDKKA